jgi:flavorubredoxin
MFTYLAEDKVLFPCDFFGAHTAFGMYDDENEGLIPLAQRYYGEIMMPFGRMGARALKKIAGLDIRLIAPSHGPVHRDARPIIQAYRDWTDDKPHNVVVLPWVTMHGSTALMVERLIAALTERGITVFPFNMAVADIGQLAMSLVDAATLIVAGPTVHVGPHPVVLDAVVLANALRPKVRFASIIGSYGWAGKMADVIQGAIPNLKVELLPPVICKGLPKEEDFQALDRLADAIAAKHRELGLMS